MANQILPSVIVLEKIIDKFRDARLYKPKYQFNYFPFYDSYGVRATLGYFISVASVKRGQPLAPSHRLLSLALWVEDMSGKLDFSTGQFSSIVGDIRSVILHLDGKNHELDLLRTTLDEDNAHVKIYLFEITGELLEDIANANNISLRAYGSDSRFEGDIPGFNLYSGLFSHLLSIWELSFDDDNSSELYLNNLLFDAPVMSRYRNFVAAENKKIEAKEKEEDERRKKELEEQKAAAQDSQGCYIATAIYGSYDCPEVWTLRRFRDYTLDETLLGRLFIKTYYAISPAFVRWFGHTEAFKFLFKKPLDKFVGSLNRKGYEGTPYNDKY